MKKEEFLKKLEVELKIAKNSPHTLRNYLKINETLLDFSNKDPSQINEDDIKLYLSEKLSDKASSSTILFLSALRYSYSNILGIDPTIKLKRPKKEKRLPTVLTKDEVKRLFNALDSKKSKLMVSLMYACGLRVSELTNLKVIDFSFDEKIGHVRQAKGKKDRNFNIPIFLNKDLIKYADKQKENNQEYIFS